MIISEKSISEIVDRIGGYPLFRDSSEEERLHCKQDVAGSIPAPGTRLSGHQPVYLPGILLFNKIALSDAFMFVPHCQYSPKSWQTRNYIRQGNDKILLSVPVEKNFGQSIEQTKILNTNWRAKHLKSIRQTYEKRPFFKVYYPYLEQLIAHPYWESLAEMNIAIIETMMDWFDIHTPIVEAVSHPVTGHKTDMLVSMCLGTGFRSYLSNEGARAYVDEEKMAENGIMHRWQRFMHPIYEQGRAFLPNLSAIDLLFNCGPASGEIVKRCGHVD